MMAEGKMPREAKSKDLKVGKDNVRLWKAPEKSSALSVVRALSAQGNQPKRHPISTLVCEDFCGWVPGTAFQPGTMYFPEPRGGI